jgi:hypothetical protein
MVDPVEVLERRVRALEVQRDQWKAKWTDLNGRHARMSDKCQAERHRADDAERRERDLGRALEDLRHRLREGRRDVA